MAYRLGLNLFPTPDKDDPEMDSGTLQDAPEPMTAQPAAAPRGVNLSALGGSSLQVGARPGELAGQAAPAAPPPNAPRMQPIGTSDAGGIDDQWSKAQRYGDEFRARTQSIYDKIKPNIFASPEERANAFAIASQHAERELSPKYMQQQWTREQGERKLEQGEKKLEQSARGLDIRANESSARADLTRGKLSVLADEVNAKLQRADAANLKARIYAEVMPLMANAQNRQAAATGVNALLALTKGVDEKHFDAGAFKSISDALPEAGQKLVELFTGGAPDEASRAVQFKRNALGQAEGMLGEALAPGGQLPPGPASGVGSPPTPLPFQRPRALQLPGRDVGEIDQRIRRAVGRMDSAPAAGAPEPQGPPLERGEPVATFRAPAAPEPPVEGLNDQANEQQAVAMLVTSGKGEEAARSLVQRAMKAASNPNAPVLARERARRFLAAAAKWKRPAEAVTGAGR